MDVVEASFLGSVPHGDVDSVVTTIKIHGLSPTPDQQSQSALDPVFVQDRSQLARFSRRDIQS